MNDPSTTPEPHHVSVLPEEVLAALEVRPGQVIVDATLGAGGHARRLAERVLPEGRVIGIDQDATMLDLARPRLVGLPVTLVQANFEELPRVLREAGIEQVDAVLADLGFCSDQMDDAARGLTFRQDGPLDMRLNRDEGETAGDLLARLSERDLADIIFQYGEERLSRRIARKIVERRRQTPFRTTEQLADLVRSCVPRSGKIDPATRTFQALRIAVNDELRVLRRLLEVLPRCLKPGGRAALISFHSLEDRQVKLAFRNREVWQEGCKKPIEATEDEARQNPRSRSAKLRWAVRRDG
jgi:16S rRNA (cytosine1402-N4)-methyltransferase